MPVVVHKKERGRCPHCRYCYIVMLPVRKGTAYGCTKCGLTWDIESGKMLAAAAIAPGKDDSHQPKASL